MRPVTEGDAEAWIRLRIALWPEAPGDHPVEVSAYLEDPPADAACFVSEEIDGTVVGFAEVGLRPHAEGCLTSPVGYLEGIYVEGEVRRRGHARGMVRACEAWARARGCAEFASDRALDNEESERFHLSAGFQEAGRIVCYRKDI